MEDDIQLAGRSVQRPQPKANYSPRDFRFRKMLGCFSSGLTGFEHKFLIIVNILAAAKNRLFYCAYVVTKPQPVVSPSE